MKGWSVEKVDEELTYEERKEFNEKYKQLERDAITSQNSNVYIVCFFVLLFFASFTFFVIYKYDKIDKQIVDCYGK